MALPLLLPVIGWDDGLTWHDAAPLLQTPWNATVPRNAYARLPDAARDGSWCNPPCPVRQKVWAEGQNGAGLHLAFRTSASEVSIRVLLLEDAKEDANESGILAAIK